MVSRYKNSIGQGWHNQSDRHSLASKGIKTGRKSNSCGYKVVGASSKINFLEKDTLTEQEVLLAKRRLNDGKITQEQIFGKEFEPKQLTKEQTKKGKEWLDNQRKTPFGVERKNNPFGLREEEILDKMDRIELKEFHDASRYGQNSYYIPIYRVYGNEGDYFEYYYDGTINIIG
jgi:hypothetical protein